MASGSIRKLTLNGITFNVAGDANITKMAPVEVEGIPHSGGNEFKQMRKTGQADGATLILKPVEWEYLRDISVLTEPFSMTYTENDGSVWTTTGLINMDDRGTEENKCDISMIPESGTWKLFGA